MWKLRFLSFALSNAMLGRFSYYFYCHHSCTYVQDAVWRQRDILSSIPRLRRFSCLSNCAALIIYCNNIVHALAFPLLENFHTTQCLKNQTTSQSKEVNSNLADIATCHNPVRAQILWITDYLIRLDLKVGFGLDIARSDWIVFSFFFFFNHC